MSGARQILDRAIVEQYNKRGATSTSTSSKILKKNRKRERTRELAGFDKKKSVSSIYFTPNNEEQVIYG
jgi:hypothetical protein